MTPLTAEDLRHLGAYEVAVRPSIGGVSLSAVTGKTYPLDAPTRDGDELALDSRQQFGVPREQVEAGTVERLKVPAGKRSNEITFGGDA